MIREVQLAVLAQIRLVRNGKSYRWEWCSHFAATSHAQTIKITPFMQLSLTTSD